VPLNEAQSSPLESDTAIPAGPELRGGCALRALNSREKLSLAGLLALVLATFASTFTFGWVYDDPPQIPGNPNLRWDRLGFLFAHHLWAGVAGVINARFYRPFLAIWFLLNKTIFGLNPHWFHVTTVAAHLIATTLAFFLARQLLKDTSAALFAAAIFGVHPLQVESVSWISSVNDSLAAIFCFASFLTYKKAREAPQNAALWWICSAFLFVCALFTKEVSVVLPAIIIANEVAQSFLAVRPKSTKATTVTIIALYGAVAIFWLLLRHRVLGQVAAPTPSATWPSALLTAPKILLFQLSRILLPINLSPHYDFRALTSANLPQALLALCAVLALAAMASYILRKSPSPSLAFAWLLLPLLLSLNLRWLNQDDFLHDRYMYMSMSGAALLAGAIYSAAKSRWPEQRLIPGLTLALIVALAFASAIQSQFWSNDVALFSRAVKIAPNNEWAQLNYGSALAARGKLTEAAPHFVRSYELKPNWNAADYAGFAFQNSGDPQQAEHWYTLALQNNPSVPDAWFARGQIRLTQNQPAEAILFFQKALALHPEAEGYNYALGQALEASNQPAAALKAYRTELHFHPNQTAAQKAITRLVGPAFRLP
jgi:protein O-mannosyl-transferase